MISAALCLALAASAPTSAAAPAAAARPTVAVLYFDYDGTSPDLAQLKKGLAQMLISDLSANTAVQVVERERLQEVMDELKLGQTDKIDEASAAKIGKLLGAQYQVMGRFSDTLGKLLLTARVLKVETGAIVKGGGFKAVGKPDDFIDLETQLAQKLDALVTTELVPAAGAQQKKTQAPGKPKQLPLVVAMRYSKALDAIDKKDKVTAKKELEALVKEKPDFVLASLDLAALVK